MRCADAYVEKVPDFKELAYHNKYPTRYTPCQTEAEPTTFHSSMTSGYVQITRSRGRAVSSDTCPSLPALFET